MAAMVTQRSFTSALTTFGAGGETRARTPSSGNMIQQPQVKLLSALSLPSTSCRAGSAGLPRAHTNHDDHIHPRSGQLTVGAIRTQGEQNVRRRSGSEFVASMPPPPKVQMNGSSNKRRNLRPGMLARFVAERQKQHSGNSSSTFGASSNLNLKARSHGASRPPLPRHDKKIMKIFRARDGHGKRRRERTQKGAGIRGTENMSASTLIAQRGGDAAPGRDGASEASKKNLDNNFLSLPNDVLKRVICNLKHRDLSPLLHTCKHLRDVTKSAMKFHFNYLTPDRRRSPALARRRAAAALRLRQMTSARRSADAIAATPASTAATPADSNASAGTLTSIPAPCAPRRLKQHRGRNQEGFGRRGFGAHGDGSCIEAVRRIDDATYEAAEMMQRETLMGGSGTKCDMMFPMIHWPTARDDVARSVGNAHDEVNGAEHEAVDVCIEGSMIS